MVEIDGNPAGAIYLDNGFITFARASWSPTLGERLSAVLQPTAEVRELLQMADRPDRDIGALLVGRSLLTTDELQAILRSVVVDAVLVLTVPLAEEASIAGIRFESAKTHWAESFCRMPVQSVRAEAVRLAERMASDDPADTARPALGEVDRVRRPSPAGSVAGTAETLPRRTAPGAAAPGRTRSPQAARPAAQVLPGMQSPGPGAAAAWPRSGSTGNGISAAPGQPRESHFTAPPADSLRRVLDGLRRLS